MFTPRPGKAGGGQKESACVRVQFHCEVCNFLRKVKTFALTIQICNSVMRDLGSNKLKTINAAFHACLFLGLEKCIVISMID